MIKRWIVLAGEEGGPVCNKMGGIWDVIDAEARTLARLAARKEIECDLKILVAGPYYPTAGADWNKGKARVTDVSGLDALDMNDELTSALDQLKAEGIDVVAAQTEVAGVPIGYLLFNTAYYDSIIKTLYGTKMTLANAIKAEAWQLSRLDSMQFERAPYGPEYTHYLGLSYAVSQFVHYLVSLGEERAKKYGDEAISEFARSVMPKMRVSLHCHEFPTFYALARLKCLGVPVRTMATLHATVPGRSSGYRSLEKVAKNDGTWDPNVPVGMATLESLAKYADVVSFVGDSTMREAMLFHKLNGIVIRNGIELDVRRIDWDKKNACRRKIQRFLSEGLHRVYGGEVIDPEEILPVFTISRLELENKGYPQLLDSLLLQNHLLRHRRMDHRFAEKMRVVCLLITSHGPKSKEKLPEDFPIDLPAEVLVGEEIRLNKMIRDLGIDAGNLAAGRRQVSAILYPQWAGPDDGGMRMGVDEIMAGCVAGDIPLPVRALPLTGLEAGREGTPCIHRWGNRPSLCRAPADWKSSSGDVAMAC